MKTASLRTALATVGATIAAVAQAQATAPAAPAGGISTTGWYSILGIVGVTAVLYWVYKKTN